MAYLYQTIGRGEANNESSVEDTENLNCSSSLTSMIERWEGEEEICKQFRVDLIDGFATKATSVLSAFVIEFVLIGASMAFLMAQHIGM